jgi:hypothetical protein
MQGEKSGIKIRILIINPLAYLTLCGCHGQNLVLGDAAASCTKSRLKITTIWDIAPCSLIDVNRCFKGAYCLHH